jgi:hypothetical protein
MLLIMSYDKNLYLKQKLILLKKTVCKPMKNDKNRVSSIETDVWFVSKTITQWTVPSIKQAIANAQIFPLAKQWNWFQIYFI